MINYEYVRTSKMMDMKKRYDAVYEKIEPLAVEEFQNAMILPCRKDPSVLWGKGGLVDSDNNYIASSGIKGGVNGRYGCETFDYVDQKVVYCGYLVKHWGHFLVEAVARLWYYLQQDETVDRYVFFIDENERREIKGNVKEFFELLGIFDKLDIINRPTRYRAVLLPELSCDRTVPYYSQGYKDIFDAICRKVANDAMAGKNRKIFFTRSQLKTAENTDIGNDMVDSFFKNNGYEIVAPEKISLSELIVKLRNAEEVAAISGSLSLNMMFAKDQMKLLMIERLVSNNEYTILTNVARNLELTHIDAYLGIYTTDLGSGPYLHFYKGMLEKYAKDYGLVPPDAYYLTRTYEKKCFAKYMKLYKKNNGYAWAMCDWSHSDIDAYREAYKDSMNYYSDYIYALRPFKLSQYVQLRYVKQAVKRLLIRCKVL